MGTSNALKHGMSTVCENNSVTVVRDVGFSWCFIFTVFVESCVNTVKITEVLKVLDVSFRVE
jgi:hypothetical protein